MPFDGLTNDQLLKDAPSIFAEHASPNVSARYAYLPTHQMIDAMREINLVPVRARQGLKRAPDGRAFALHEVTFRPRDFYARAPELGELHPEINVRNSHDRTSGYAVEAGLLRAICTNGMRTNDAKLELGFKVRHTGKGRMEQMLSGMETLVKNLDRVVDVANDWNQIQLSGHQTAMFARQALELKGTALSVDWSAVLMARRPHDYGNTLWRVFNRVQENITKGGLPGKTTTGKNATLKGISTLASDVDFNRKLWGAAAHLAAEVRSQISLPALA